jgi:glycosyltransferase involved in cell wall biosynthesis
MRIAHIITRLIRGGADENTLLSCNGQAEKGHEVHLIYGAEASAAMVSRLHPDVHRHQIQALLRPLTPLNDAWAACKTAALLRRIRPQIVHTHTSKAGAIGRVAARFASIPGVVHGIHILPFLNVGRAEQFAYLAAERLLAPVTDAFVNVSQGMMDTALENGIGPGLKHVVVPSGMDIERFRESAPVTDQEVGEAFGRRDASTLKLLVMVAALEPRKRVKEFLSVLASVAAVDPRVALAVLGEGPDHDAIEARARELGIGDRVALLGFRNDVERWVARADVCVLASEREGLPRAVVQYVLAGRPTVATSLPGLDAVVRHGRSGFLVPTDRLPEMVAPISALLADPALALSMSREARSIDLSRWSTRHMVDRLEDVYRSVLNHEAILSEARS